MIIDGSYGEGGGSIVRQAVSLAAVTGTEIEIENIRKGRCTSGLKEQHLQGVRAVASLCDGSLEGDVIGSCDIKFVPGDSFKSSLKVNIGTAGSVGLVLQALMLPCFFSSKNIKIEIKGGGTLGLHAPNLLYTSSVLLPLISKFGYNGSVDILKHGFYPKGGADVIFKSKPCSEVSNFECLEKGKLLDVKGYSLSSEDLKTAKVSERMSSGARESLNIPEVSFENQYAESLSSGAGILLVGSFENSLISWDALGEKGKRAEVVGSEAGSGFIKQISSSGVIDDYMVDQILSFLAFSSKSSKFRVNSVSEHAKTNMWLIKKFLDVDFKVRGNVVEVRK